MDQKEKEDLYILSWSSAEGGIITEKRKKCYFLGKDLF